MRIFNTERTRCLECRMPDAPNVATLEIGGARTYLCADCRGLLATVLRTFRRQNDKTGRGAARHA